MLCTFIGARKESMARTFTLNEIRELLAGELVNGGDGDRGICSFVSSSQHNNKESLFVAYRGVGVDGHDFIEGAFENGSVAAVVTDAGKLGGRPGIVVPDSRRALSRLAAAFSGDPSRELLTIGITGTNGKTTIHWLLYHALARLSYPGIRIGSLGISAHGQVERSGKAITSTGGEILMTTPSAMDIHETMRFAVDAGFKSAVLETSSHALDQHRVSDVFYDAAIFSNLSPDHLNYHQDMEEYFAAKKKLFERIAATGEGCGGAAINADCPWGQRLLVMARQLGLRTLAFGEAQDSQVRIVEFLQGLPESTLKIEFEASTLAIRTGLIGEYNGSNLAGAFAGLIALGFAASEAAHALDRVPPVPGRLEAVGSDEIAVFVDYAHTGEGLKHLLSGIKPFVKNNLWVLFGCGGGKDPGKRRAMGLAAAELADKIVLTNDNPRSEDPAKIIEEILDSGCQPEFIDFDRGLAIERTLRSALKGDVVVLAGKGHEDYQIIGTETLRFSDSEAALKLRDGGALER